MWKQAKLKFRQLLFDDSGIAIAYTIVTFLVFFILCISTFAMSENIRRKMELQNACDAAAYSAAVVQADMLSRIAVLNRALSWTYAETNKRQMDETVYDWLCRTRDSFYATEDSIRLAGADASALCLCPAKAGIGNNGQGCCDGIGGNMIYWMVGYVNQKDLAWANYYLDRGTPPRPGYVRLNESRNVSIGDIVSLVGNPRTALAGSYSSQANLIQQGAANVAVLNREISYLSENIENFVRVAADYTVKNHHFNDKADFCVLLDMSGCLTADVNENEFLRYSRNTVELAFDRGAGVWWNLQDDVDGIGRNYRPNDYVVDDIPLVSRFCWVICGHGDEPHKACVHNYVEGDWNRITGKKTQTIVAKPQKINRGFFGRAGSIVVAAQLDSVNPLSELFGTGGIYDQSLYFGRKLLAVSAARAGIRLKSDSAGYYRVFYPGDTVGDTKNYTNGVWNLCEDDWDAVMLPIPYAWSPATAADCRFTADTGKQLLNAVYQQFNRTDCPEDITDVMRH